MCIELNPCRVDAEVPTGFNCAIGHGSAARILSACELRSLTCEFVVACSPARRPPDSRASPNVSQASRRPLSSPRRSHVTRCSDEPCVNDSGDDAALRLPLQPVVADRRGGAQTFFRVARVEQPLAARRSGPRRRRSSRPAAPAAPTAALPFALARPLARALTRSDRPGQRLDVMPDLVGDDVGLREVAGRAEALVEIAEERRDRDTPSGRRGSRTAPSPTGRRRTPTAWRRVKSTSIGAS